MMGESGLWALVIATYEGRCFNLIAAGIEFYVVLATGKEHHVDWDITREKFCDKAALINL
jgi:hypothetical protein